MDLNNVYWLCLKSAIPHEVDVCIYKPCEVCRNYLPQWIEPKNSKQEHTDVRKKTHVEMNAELINMPKSCTSMFWQARSSCTPLRAYLMISGQNSNKALPIVIYSVSFNIPCQKREACPFVHVQSFDDWEKTNAITAF